MMNSVCALRGTWMGRHVKTEKEVLEEIAQFSQNGEDSVEVAQEKNNPTPAVSVEDTSEGSKPSPSVVLWHCSNISMPKPGVFRFSNVPYQGSILKQVLRPLNCFCSEGKIGSFESHQEWLNQPGCEYSGFIIPDMELEYQLMRISFEHRDDPKCKEAAKTYSRSMARFYRGGIITADSIEFKLNRVSIINHGSISPQERSCKPLSQLNIHLSENRPESKLLEILSLSSREGEFVDCLLGYGANNAGTVLSYSASRVGHRLRATSVHLSEFLNRPYPLSFGIDDQEHFAINIYQETGKSLMAKVLKP